jgi:hypothetical protein
VEDFGVRDEISFDPEWRVECVDDARMGDNVREKDLGCVVRLEDQFVASFRMARERNVEESSVRNSIQQKDCGDTSFAWSCSNNS